MTQHVLLGRASCEMLENGGVTRAEAAALGCQPRVEMRTAIHIEIVEEIADEQCGQHAETGGIEHFDTGLRSLRNEDNIDCAIREIEPDRVAGRFDAAPFGGVDEAPELAEAPA